MIGDLGVAQARAGQKAAGEVLGVDPVAILDDGAGGIVDDRIEIFEHGDPDFAEYAVLVEAMPRLLRCAYIEQGDLFAPTGSVA